MTESQKQDLRIMNKVPERLTMYGWEIKRGRCRGFCHNGHDFNMVVKDYYCHCFASDTKIITRDGVYTINDILGKDVEVINGNGEWEKVQFKSYGFDKIWEITLKSNKKTKIIRTTKKHEWFVQNHKKPITTDKLKSGYRLERQWLNVVEEYKIVPEAVRHGFLYGDGNIERKNQNGTFISRANLLDERKYNFAKNFFHITKYTSRSYEKTYGTIMHKTDYNVKELPKNLDDLDYIFSFLAGYFAADGSCNNDSVVINSSKLPDLVQIKHFFTLIGIPSYPIYCQIKNEKSNGGCLSYKKEHRLYGLRVVASQVPKNFYLSEKRDNYERKFKNGYLGWTVCDITETNNIQEVFCCQTSTHSFVLEDFILTHNCYVCNQSFDIFDIVMFFENCTFPEAVNKLNKGIDFDTFRKIKKIRCEMSQKQKEAERKDNRYWELWSKWIMIDTIIRYANPCSQLYADGLHRREYLHYRMEAEL